MAAPATPSSSNSFTQGLLQSLAPWVTGASPSALDGAFAQYGGTAGLLSAMLQDSPGSQGAAAFGRALQENQDEALKRAGARQQLAQGALGLQRMQAMMPLLTAAFQQASGANGSPAAPNALTGANGIAPQPGSPPAANGSPAVSGTQGASAVPPFIRATPGQLAARGPTPMLPMTSAAGPQTGGAPMSQGTAQQAYQSLLGQYQLGALFDTMGMNGSGFTGMADFQAKNNPALVTSRAVAGNPLSQDQAMLYQAYASGNPLAVKAAQMKYLTDSKLVNPSSWNNSLTLFGGLTPSMLGYSAINPQQGYQMIGGTASPIPNILPTRQALAGAQARGAAEGQLQAVTDAQGNKYLVPKSSLLPGGAGGPAASGGGAVPALAGIGPSQEGYLAGRGEESAKYVQGLQEGADAATNANYALDQMMQDAQRVSLGPAAGAAEWFNKGFAAVGQTFGVAPPEKLSNYQELDKYANQVAFAATRQMGSREAAQIVHLQMQSNPNKQLTAAAFTDLAGSMKAMNGYLIAKNQVVQAAARGNGGDALAAAAQWTRTVDPRVWDLTLSPQMGAKWGATIGAPKIAAAYPYLTADEQQALLQNLPTSVLKGLR